MGVIRDLPDNSLETQLAGSKTPGDADSKIVFFCRKGKWEAQKIGELEMLQRRSEALEQKQTSIDSQQLSLQAQKDELEQRLDDLQNAGDFLKGLLNDLNSRPSHSKKHRYVAYSIIVSH